MTLDALILDPMLQALESRHRAQADDAGISRTPPLQRTRLATEALYLVMRHVFDDLGAEPRMDLHRDQPALARHRRP